MVEYAIHYAQDGSYPPNFTKQGEEESCQELCRTVVLSAIIIKGFVTAMHVQVSIGGPYSRCRRGSKCCSEISSGGPYLSTKLVPGVWSI